ncbi:MAG: sulfatase-like hydrolase/transferase [Stackebrandtia sp.]
MSTNVLVFLTDDHAQWAAGCYGNSELRTPTLDHLANTGVRMDNAFTPTPVCSPGRACLMTGRTPSQHGIHDYLAEADPQVAATDWLRDETTLARLLHDRGYTTALSGKWHLGRPDRRAPGYDYWYSRAAPVPKPEGFDSPWPAPPAAGGGYDRHAITDHAVDFLRRRDSSRPFFLTVGYFGTHSPWTGHPERLVSSYRDCHFGDIPPDATHPLGRLRSESVYATRADPREALAQYYAAVTDIDEQVGRVIDELELQQLRESTLVIYTSDHGLNTGHHGIWGKGNGTLPYNMLEESIRVPLIVNHPGGVLGGQSRSELVSHCDTFLSVLDHIGIPQSDLDESRNYPGASHAGLWLGKPEPGRFDRVFGEYGNLRMVRTRSHKLVRRYPDGPDELFDLVADPRETTNLYPDPGYGRLVESLTRSLTEYFDRHSDPVKSGLDVARLPRHNSDEAWRDTGPHTLTAEATWIADLTRRQLAEDERDSQLPRPHGMALKRCVRLLT